MRRLFGRRGSEREVRDEMAAHLDHRTDELVAGGMAPDAARRRAEEEFGDLERLLKETVAAREEVRGPGRHEAGFMDPFAGDLAWAARQLRRNPLFAAVACVTLTLGIGAVATVASVVRTVVLAPLPYGDPSRLVVVEEVTPGGADFSVSEPTYLDFREGLSSFSGMGAFTQRAGRLATEDGARAVTVGRASASLLPTLGLEPILGRGFTADEDRPGPAGSPVLLGHALWRDGFGGDPGVVGREVVLNDRAHRVVGVLPSDELLLDHSDLFVPLAATAGASRDDHDLEVVARLARGVGMEAAREELRALAGRLAEIHVEDRGWSARMTPLRDVLVGGTATRAGWALLGAAGLLLLIACVNVSNLLLARATTREGEIGVRVALGAGRLRIVRQLLTESLLLSVAGGTLGVGLAALLLPVVRSAGQGWIPRLGDATLDGTTLLLTLAVTVAASLFFGIAPALALRRASPTEALRGAGRDGRRGGRTALRALVVGQLALSAILLVGAGLLVRSFQRLAAVDPGFRVEDRLVGAVDLPDPVYSAEERARLMGELIAAASAVPGVERAGAMTVEPFSGMNLANFVAREDRMPDRASEFTSVSWRSVTPGLVEALGMELLAGRTLLPADRPENGPMNIVIGEGLARRLWPGSPRDAVGGTLVWGDPGGSRMTVVGVVGDLQDVELGESPPSLVLVPHRFIPWARMTLIVHAAGGEADRQAVADGVREALRGVDPSLPVGTLRPLGTTVVRALAMPRFHLLLVIAFGTVGLALALAGVYGVTAFGVSRRFREIGIRLTLGADPVGVRRMVLREAAGSALLGVVLGLAGAWIAGRWMETLLYETAPLDLPTWAGVAALLTGASLAAAWLPAQRATRVDPRVALSE